MIRNLSKTALALMASLTLLSGCNNKGPADKVRQNGLPKASASALAQGGAVAIVDIDTLASQYDYCIEGQKALEAKQNGFRNQLNAKGQALQRAMIDLQKKAQGGGFTNQAQAEQARTSLERQQQALQKYQETAEREMSKATEAYQKTLRDSLNSFLRTYNADGRFKVILSKSGDNVLYVDPAVDITHDVVTGLNQRYAKKSGGK